MKYLLTLNLSLFYAAHLPSADAQDRFSIALSGVTDFATQELGDADLGMGIGFEATLGYRFMPHLSAYAGWGWNNSQPMRSLGRIWMWRKQATPSGCCSHQWAPRL